MRSAVGRVALLLFGSGFCALVYQTAWLRSSAWSSAPRPRRRRRCWPSSWPGSASAACCSAGGPTATRSPLAPLRGLEAGIAVDRGALAAAAGASSSWLYVALGGSARLGARRRAPSSACCSRAGRPRAAHLPDGRHPARGGAGGRSARRLRPPHRGPALRREHPGRGARRPAHHLLRPGDAGDRARRIWIAALLNLLVVLAAREPRPRAARETAGRRGGARAAEAAAADGRRGRGRAGWSPLAAALVGFAFLLMELVWYRMLGPLLGGSSYTFGLILAVALLGIGLGGAALRRGRARAPAHAAGVRLHLRAGGAADRPPLRARRPAGGAGRAAAPARPAPASCALVGGWTVVTALVVLPRGDRRRLPVPAADRAARLRPAAGRPRGRRRPTPPTPWGRSSARSPAASG